MATNAQRQAASHASTRVLLIATDELVGPELLTELHDHLERIGAGQVAVVAPAVEKTAFRHALGDVDSASLDAEQRLQTSLAELRRAGIEARGEVGDGDPLTAAEDALRQFAADEVLIVAHSADQARWFEDGLFERAEAELGPTVRMVSVRHHEEGERALHLAAVEESGPGHRQAVEAERELSLSRNLPPVSLGDLAGIVVAIVGTIVAIVLAAAGPGSESAGGAAQILIAMAVTLINMAHVVGLTLLESVRYRGGWQRFLRNLSLTATPLAILANGLIALLG